MKELSDVGKRIKRMRDLANITQRDLSKQLKISVSYLSKLERGNEKIGIETLNKLSKIFRCDVNWLLWGDGESR